MIEVLVTVLVALMFIGLGVVLLYDISSWRNKNKTLYKMINNQERFQMEVDDHRRRHGNSSNPPPPKWMNRPKAPPQPPKPNKGD